MCGIHGFINSKNAETNSDDFIKSGCIAGMLRGVDSTGVAVITTKAEEVDLRKLPLPGNYFVEDKQFAKMLPAIRAANAITIAHTRAATVGKVAAHTAHPFKFWDKDTGRELVGVHNGTLTAWQHKEGARSYDVDSQWALHNIFKKGVDAFKDFTGAYCFVWWDSETPTKLYMARNDQRTMHVAFTEKGGLAYASEAGMVAWLTDRHNIKLAGDIKALKSGILYTFDLEDIMEVEQEELPKSSYTSTHTQSYQTNRSTTTYGTVVARVDALLEKIKKEESDEEVATVAALVPNTSPSGERRPVVTKEEMDDAKSLEVLHNKVKFRPTHSDNHSETLYGTVDLYDGAAPWTCDAIMRYAGSVVWKKDEEFEVTVLGASLSTNDAVVIVSKPRVTLTAVSNKLEDADVAVAH